MDVCVCRPVSRGRRLRLLALRRRVILRLHRCALVHADADLEYITRRFRSTCVFPIVVGSIDIKVFYTRRDTGLEALV